MPDNNLISKYIKPLSTLPTLVNRGGKLKEKIKCLLFDIYGTLFISGSGDISIARKVTQDTRKLELLLLKFGTNNNPKTILENLFTAIEKKHEELREKGIDFPEVEIDRIWMSLLENNDLDTIKKFAVEFELIVNPVYPMPHLKDLLSACKSLKVIMGIISNAQFYTPYLFEWHLNSNLDDLGFHSDLTFFSYKCGYAKPSTYMFKAAADKLENLGVPAQAVLYVGNDMLNDIYPAKTVGFKTALFAGDARSLRLREDDPRCKNISADLVVTDLIQLLDYI